MKQREFEVRFKDEYYNIVRSVINNYYNYKIFGRYNGKGIFKNNIIVKQDGDYTNIWFKCKSNKLSLELCRKVLHDLEKFKIITIIREPK